MMMKRICLISILILISSGIYAQEPEVFKLEDCLSLSAQNYPSVKNDISLREMASLELKNIASAYLPIISVNGQMSYQSDVIDIDLPIPGLEIPDLPHDQYKISLDINQLIYGGGGVKAAKKMREARTGVELNNYEIDKYQFKKRVIDFYFAVLLLNKQEEILHKSREILKERYQSLEVAVENGVVLEADLSMLKAELLKIEQALDDIEASRVSLKKNLELLCGISFPSDVSFVTPRITFAKSTELNRPELKVFSVQKDVLYRNQDLFKAEMMPKLFVFTQLGYGRPGLNYFSQDFDSYYILGARLSWTPWDWNKNKRKRKILDQQMVQLDRAGENISRDFKLALNNESGTIKKLEKQIEKDKEIMILRAEISKAYFKRLEEGVITSGEYLNQHNNEIKARLEMESRKIQLSQSKTNYLYISGNL